MESENEKIKLSYETLWKFIIRPPRDNYDEGLDLIGNPYFSFKGRKYIRKDYELISSEGYLMKCSFFEPIESDRPRKIMPVIIYLHGNSSSRLEGMKLIRDLLKNDINLFVVDFPGCGLSEGEYISLGYHESHDVKILVDFIDKLPGVGYIGLWGRSMGAATTMIYSHKDERIKAICMDSPFADFSLLAKELVLKKIKLPGLLIDGALKIIRLTVKNKNGLDIDKLKPIDAAGKTTQPAIFIHANEDELINNSHSEMLINAYKGKDKCLKRCDGGHNTRRPKRIIREVGEFFYKHLVSNYHENYNNNIDINNSKNSNISDNANDNKSFDNNKIGNDDKKFNNENKINEQNKIENKEKNDLITNDNIENLLENEKHSLQNDEKNKNEMDLLNKELSKCFDNCEKKMKNIDINNDFKEN